VSVDAPRKSSRSWIWFFVILTVLVVLAIATLVFYNLRQQLQPAQLAAARKLWEEKRPPDYVLTYVKKDKTSNWFVVTVHGRKIVSVIMQQEIGGEKDAQALEPRQYHYYDMDGLFDSIERFLEMREQKDSPRTFMTAVFDPNNGQLLRFVRSVRSPRESVQIDVEPIQAPRAAAAL
jgi:serine protease inhibitor ecotin